jgi:superoxide dismutase, Cu-Zn family
MRTITLTLLAATATLAACAPVKGGRNFLAARGALLNAQGTDVGIATVDRLPDGSMTLVLVTTGIPAGTYGAHVHMVGQCDGPRFTSAGAHWNPTTRQHGRLNPQGSHHGDLPNLVIAPDGRGRLSAALPGMFEGAGGLMDTDGAALVVHARPDDELTDPTGNSGDRIACAVLTRV